MKKMMIKKKMMMMKKKKMTMSVMMMMMTTMPGAAGGGGAAGRLGRRPGSQKKPKSARSIARGRSQDFWYESPRPGIPLEGDAAVLASPYSDRAKTVEDEGQITVRFFKKNGIRKSDIET